MKKLLLSITAVLLIQPTFAHEGHGQAPGILKASHGGTVLAGNEINLEYMVSANEVKLFPVTHDGKDLAADKVKVSATTKAPKGNVEVLKITPATDGSLMTQVDFKNSHRVEVNVTTETNGKKDSFKFQVEK